ncbi:recombinase-like helix-turn-helix domain-containing protein [Paracoccus luteus]|uniref:recombinase-like helix-turn-helix domain-containing protein n=1 Tax=Paracoccus luteus TaxID=2508543 RepID=UPI0010702FC1|nr:recombinase-like helix-turn-helix domain-containing protein [Paracoccus luteus]
MDVFKDRLSRRAADTSRPALAHQSLGRPLTGTETALKDALMAVFGEGTQDFGAVAAGLAARRVVAPVSGRTDWDEALLRQELAAINADLDAAYREHGYGA